MLKAITRQTALIDVKVRAYNESLKSNKGYTNTECQLNHNTTNDSKSPVSVAWYFDHVATPEDIAVTVTEADFHAAKAELVPSVSAEELGYYEKVKETFEGAKENNSIRKKEERRSSSRKGKGKLIEDVNDSNGSSTLAIRSSSLANGMTDLDDGDDADNDIGSSSGKGKAKGIVDLATATDTLKNGYAVSMDHRTRADIISAGGTTSKLKTNADVPIDTVSSDSVGKHETGSRIQSEMNSNVDADADADADEDSSNSDNSKFDDAQSKVSKVNGLLSRSNSSSDTSSNSDDSDAGSD